MNIAIICSKKDTAGLNIYNKLKHNFTSSNLNFNNNEVLFNEKGNNKLFLFLIEEDSVYSENIDKIIEDKINIEFGLFHFTETFKMNRHVKEFTMERTIKLLVIFAMLLLVTGCTTQLSAEEAKNRIIEANSNINTYSVDMKADYYFEMSIMGEKMNFSYFMDIEGNSDKINKKHHYLGTFRTITAGVEQDTDVNIYQINDFIYMNMMETWIKQRIDADKFSEKDDISQFIEMLDTGNVEIIEETNKHYIVKISPDTDLLKKYMLGSQQQENSFIDQDKFNMNLEDYNLKVWINKNSYILEKTEYIIKSEMSPKNDITGNMTFNLHVTTEISDINEPVNIELPEEALEANSMTGLNEENPKRNDINRNYSSYFDINWNFDKELGCKDYNFRNGETQNVCCELYKSNDNTWEYCKGEGNYTVEFLNVNGKQEKVEKGMFQGYLCRYYFVEGEYQMRSC